MSLIQVSLGLTVAECAQRIGVTPETIRTYISDGRLDALAVGPKLYFVPESALEHFLVSREVAK